MQMIATCLFAVGICSLFLLNRDRHVRTSLALWIPVTWEFIACSRMLSEWLQATPPDPASQYLDGSPLDRAFFAGLLLVGFAVLFSRRPRVVSLLKDNAPLLLFLAFCALSTVWADYPGVSFKRWIKSLGDVVMVMIVLTDAEPIAAVKRLLAWTGFLLVPLSILFIKFYPDLGGGYQPWSWAPVWTGVTTNKNTLGMVCMVVGVGASWRLLEEFKRQKGSGRALPILAHSALLAMTVWVLWMANSMTSLACFLMATGVLLATSLGRWAKTSAFVNFLVCATVLAAFSVLFLGVGMGLMTVMGRDPTLTGRTELWSFVFHLGVNPLFGAGFESFWIGERLEKIWSHYWWHPNEAHNGYLEVYLNLGLIGVGLLGYVLANGYRKIVSAVQHEQEMGTLSLAYLVVAITYNFTEAAFRMMSPIWFFLLLALLSVSQLRAAESTTGYEYDEAFLADTPMEETRYSRPY